MAWELVAQTRSAFGSSDIWSRKREQAQLERATRIELAFSAWEADVLPLNYARVFLISRKSSYLKHSRVTSDVLDQAPNAARRDPKTRKDSAGRAPLARRRHRFPNRFTELVS
jgi:hypothetical protein